MTVRLTDFQIAETAWAAGFTMVSRLTTAIAVCLAESGGNPDAVNRAGNVPPSTDRGLWQINSYYHPEVSDAQAFDPFGCAKAAYRISEGGMNWNPWATYTTGSFLGFMHRAILAAPITAPGYFPIPRLLRLTSPQLHGIDVAGVQHVLGSPIVVDGVYGPVTTAAVADYQRGHRLTADGQVGPETCAAMALRWTGGVIHG